MFLWMTHSCRNRQHIDALARPLSRFRLCFRTAPSFDIWRGQVVPATCAWDPGAGGRSRVEGAGVPRDPPDVPGAPPGCPRGGGPGGGWFEIARVIVVVGSRSLKWVGSVQDSPFLRSLLDWMRRSLARSVTPQRVRFGGRQGCHPPSSPLRQRAV